LFLSGPVYEEVRCTAKVVDIAIAGVHRHVAASSSWSTSLWPLCSDEAAVFAV